jgi:hypothetical protein
VIVNRSQVDGHIRMRLLHGGDALRRAAQSWSSRPKVRRPSRISMNCASSRS